MSLALFHGQKNAAGLFQQNRPIAAIESLDPEPVEAVSQTQQELSAGLSHSRK